MRSHRLFLPLALLLLAALTIVGCANRSPRQGQGDGMKVAFVLVGPINDAGWNASTYEGAVKVSKEMGFQLLYSESVPLAESQSTIRDYASRGAKVIIANNFGFGDAMERVAKDFPETKFAVLTGRVKGPNLSSYDAGQREGTFMAGVLAALMTKSGTIGVVGGVDLPSIIKAAEGYKAGARYIKPGIRILTTYTGSFSDIAKAKEATLAQISSGADIVAHVANQAGLGVIQAAKEKAIFAIGSGADQHKVAPQAVLATAITDHSVLIRMVLDDAQSGSFGNQLIMPGLKEGVSYLSPFHDLESSVPPEVKQRLQEIAQAIKAGKLKVPETEVKSD
jgi:basic membrane protein A